MNNQVRTEEKDEKLNTILDQVFDKVEDVDGQEKEEILANFTSFRRYLADKINLAQRLGLSEEQLAVVAQKMGDYLSKHEAPRNREEKLLSELWQVGTKEEQHMLAHMLVKIAKTTD
ncbi:DUF3243 domain-containing protein [Marinicrinis sediminis]|uniref:DUF3243 domain-containing protein n=1 Tax=Marinicrinis sediminis TaxID=1652465 RepID=A0ABW5RHG2_9BACL